MKKHYLLFLLLFLSGTVKAQDQPKQTLWDNLHFWADAGFGFALPDLAMGGGGSATITYGKYYFSLRGLNVDATPSYFNPIELILSADNPYHGYLINDEAAFCIGLLDQGKNGIVGIGIGVSYLNGFHLAQPIDSTDNGHRNFHTIGFAVDAQLCYSLFSWIGISLHPYLDINPKQSFGGFMFCVQIGKLYYTQ